MVGAPFLELDDRDSTPTLSASRITVSNGPDVLFVVTHAVSRSFIGATAQDLGRTAPQSFTLPAKLNAEALEMQGKQKPTQLEYEWMNQ